MKTTHLTNCCHPDHEYQTVKTIQIITNELELHQLYTINWTSNQSTSLPCGW